MNNPLSYMKPVTQWVSKNMILVVIIVFVIGTFLYCNDAGLINIKLP